MTGLPPINLDLALSEMSSFTGQTGASANTTFGARAQSAPAWPVWAMPVLIVVVVVAVLVGIYLWVTK